jgi:hypothetical protein
MATRLVREALRAAQAAELHDGVSIVASRRRKAARQVGAARSAIAVSNKINRRQAVRDLEGGF